MPKRLPLRFRAECIAEFRVAAEQRAADALTLAEAGRGTGAIYLWGYVAEMTLKAAYFSCIGFPEKQPIAKVDLRAGLAEGGARPGSSPWHDLEVWAQALANARAASPSRAYAEPDFATAMQARARIISGLWDVALRYHANRPYPHEVAQAREAAEWLLARSRAL